MNKIRVFDATRDYNEVCRWWAEAGEPRPPLEIIPRTTFILENNVSAPWICLSLIQFNVSQVAWSAGLVSNPDLPREGRKEAVKQLWDFVAGYAKNLGYKSLMCVAPRESLEKRYKEMGFMPTYRNQTFMVREL